MSKIKNVLGTSLISFLLVIWGLFMVCSGRVPNMNLDDDFASIEDDYGDRERTDLIEQLAMLDEESTNLEDNQRAEILEALGVDPEGADISSRPEEDFLTEELFLDLEVEIAELEKISRKRSNMIDSLNLELQESDYRISALRNIVGDETPQFASTKTRTAPKLTFSNGTASEYELSYQTALNDVYGRNYRTAITKFRSLLKLSDSANLADNCQYWIGECYYAMKNYETAIAEFEKVFAFENNNKADDAQFMIGMSYLKSGDQSLAQMELSTLLSFYEKSEYATRAERQLLDLNI
ncbi:MAG: tol-pal system YbgF family protein [bacterium]